jgi:hypothetical protein
MATERKPTNPFDCDITTQPSYKLGDPITITFEINNTSSDPYQLLIWQTPLQKEVFDFFEVRREGEIIPYDGRMVKRGEPTSESYIVIDPGQKITESVDLSTSYKIDKPGNYSVTLKGKIHDAFKVSSNKKEKPRKSEQFTPFDVQEKSQSFKVIADGQPKMTSGEKARKESGSPPLSKNSKSAKVNAKAPVFIGGNSSQQGDVTTAHQNALYFSSLSYSQMDTTTNNTNALYQTWYGAFDQGRYDEVKGDYANIANAIVNDEITYDLSGDGCDPGDYAYTYKNTRKVWLCSSFWTASQIGIDSKFGTLIHELSHAVCETDDNAYGQTACKNLATSDPVKAINNADSHEYFAENLALSTYGKGFTFITDKSTFGTNEVQDTTSYPNAFWLLVDGYTINQVGAATPALSGSFKNIAGLTISSNPSGTQYEIPSNNDVVQRILFPYDINFSSSSLATFPTPGSPPIQKVLDAAITISSNNYSASTLFELIAGADPYFTDIDPAQNNEFWLSRDLRIFTVTPGQNNQPVGNIGSPPKLTPADVTNLDTAAGFKYVQDLINYLNSNYSNPSGTDPFSLLPNQGDAFTGDSSVNPFTFDFSNIFNPKFYCNYNYAIGKVRLKGTAGPAGAAKNVRVFFRLWSTETADTDYQPTTTYLSNLNAKGLPESPQVGVDHHTIPFFATGNYLANTDYSNGGINNRDVQIKSGNYVWAYFGCFLNLYDSQNTIDGNQIQQWLNGTHHCIVAQIAYDDAPIVNANGVAMSPENSDKLAQRNLQITLSDNPGEVATHRIPQTFDTRPSRSIVEQGGSFQTYPDELMINWGNTPEGSIASVYWPQVDASQVLDLASKLYTTNLLSASDKNTIQCTVTKGITYVPIPAGSGQNFAGLITVDLPSTVTKGQEFNILVRRITSRRSEPDIVIAKGRELAAANIHTNRNWRYVTGTFQIKIPVSTKDRILFGEENTLAIMKWRLQAMSPANRWYPVLERYISYLSARVDGLGGNSDNVKPSLQGVPVRPRDQREECEDHTGKICEVIFNCFGEFEGFVLNTCNEKVLFKSCMKSLSALALQACRHNLTVSICADKKTKKIIKIAIRC